MITYAPTLAKDEQVDHIETYRLLVDQEEDTKWLQGDHLVATVNELLGTQARSAERTRFFEDVGEAVYPKQSTATVRMRYRTARLIPSLERAQDRSWYFHCLCARTEDSRNPEHAGRSIQWLEIAVARGWGQSELEHYISASGRDPAVFLASAETGSDELPSDPVPTTTATVTRAAEASVTDSGDNWLKLRFAMPFPALEVGEQVRVTISRVTKED